MGRAVAPASFLLVVVILLPLASLALEQKRIWIRAYPQQSLGPKSDVRITIGIPKHVDNSAARLDVVGSGGYETTSIWPTGPIDPEGTDPEKMRWHTPKPPLTLVALPCGEYTALVQLAHRASAKPFTDTAKFFVNCP